MDVGINNERVRITAEYYRNKCMDLLGEAPMDPTTGISRFSGNVASMKSYGYDLSIHTDNLTGALQWKSSFLMSYTKDKITEYFFPPSTQSGLVSGSGYSVGKPVRALHGYRSAGLSATGDPQGYLDHQVSTNYTAILNSKEFTGIDYYGSTVPVIYGSFLNTLTFKNIELSFMLLYKGGYYFRNPSAFNLQNVQMGLLQGVEYYDRWQQPGDEASTHVPAPLYPFNSTRQTFITYSPEYYDKADHIRLQDIRIGYSLSNKNLPRLPFQKVQLYVRAANVGLLWNANKWGIDPEMNPLIPQITGVSYGRHFAGGVSINL